MSHHIYIASIRQISAQPPLSDEWFEQPVFYAEPYVRAHDPDFTRYLAPNASRRMGRILKRALIVSRQAMEASGITQPDAIVTATGLGCIESTEVFLDRLVRGGEEMLPPTPFMQSTHNTIGSLIAINTQCHSYNATHTHRGISFECALLDAFIQLKSGKIQTALTGAHDEMTPQYFALLKKNGYLGRPNQVFAGETAVAIMLSTQKTDDALCEIEIAEQNYISNDGSAHYAMLAERLCDIQSPDYIMVGVNGVAETDSIYFENCQKWFPDVPLLKYKNVFGEGYSASAFGFYAAAVCLHRGKIPAYLRCDAELSVQKPNSASAANRATRILCYNHFENKSHTFTMLSRC